jgi:hypothetical protein
MPGKTQFEIGPAERCLLTLLTSRYNFCHLQMILNMALGSYFREYLYMKFILAEEMLADY